MQANELASQLDGKQEAPMEVVPEPSNSTAAAALPNESHVQKYDRLLQALQTARTEARTAMKGAHMWVCTHEGDDCVVWSTSLYSIMSHICES